MSTRTVPISSQELDNAIEVLASAGQALQPSRFQRFSYRALMISADAAMLLMLASLLVDLASQLVDMSEWPHGAIWMVLFVSTAIFVSVLVAIISLALNIPLFRKAFRDRARLRERGLNSLSQFLWKESRRRRRISRAREALLVVIGLYNVVLLFLAGKAFLESRQPGAFDGKWTFADDLYLYYLMAVVVMIAGILISARYLRNQRERMDLTASADELRKTLQSLRQRTDIGIVSVPAELLEQTAKIESTQIAAERKEAVLQSIGFDDSAYAIRYSASAAAQRATLETADRLELVDLLDQLSTEGAPIEPPGAAKDATMRRTIRSKRVEIEYSADEASRLIQIVAVAAVSGSDTSLTGARHA
jgi:hypothetical protein